MISRQIQGRNAMVLAYLELVKDKMFLALPEEDKLRVINEATAIGEEMAGYVNTKYGTNDPRKIAQALGVRVYGSEEGGKNQVSVYLENKEEIVIYRRAFEQISKEIGSQELGDKFLKFMVARALFFHLEKKMLGDLRDKFKFRSLKIGPWESRRPLKDIQKVAAQAFVRSLLELEFSPEVFDYLTYVLFTRHLN